ncbi:MAG: nucleotidyltransferase domain-containing protein [Chloroflexi bacterium]|nr:nucleotidyltransferase domain-containing protein [Chloroflexota bacterium]
MDEATLKEVALYIEHAEESNEGITAEGEAAVNKTHLSVTEHQALQVFLAYLKRSFATEIEWVALFGSKARGDSGPDSDIDVLVIMSKEDREVRREILKEAARISLEYDTIISPRVIGANRWKEMEGFSLYQNIQREATRLGLMNGDELALEMA